MGAPIDLLKADIELKEENKALFRAIIKALRLIVFVNGFFIIGSLSVIIYLFDRRPREVQKAITIIEDKITTSLREQERARQEWVKASRMKDSATVERLRAERAKNELLEIENKYK